MASPHPATPGLRVEVHKTKIFVKEFLPIYKKKVKKNIKNNIFGISWDGRAGLARPTSSTEKKTFPDFLIFEM